jgi:uracil DNA glycosylase
MNIKPNINNSWKNILNDEFKKKYFLEIEEKISKDLSK